MLGHYIISLTGIAIGKIRKDSGIKTGLAVCSDFDVFWIWLILCSLNLRIIFKLTASVFPPLIISPGR